MSKQQADSKESGDWFFHTRFALAVLACFLIILASFLYLPYHGDVERIKAQHGLVVHTVGVIVFTGITWIILSARTGSQQARVARWGWLAAFEQKMLVAVPMMAPVLVWLTGLAFFLLMIGNDKDAAIFMMALIAIYVAVEHLGGLREHRRLMDAQRLQIGEYNTKLASLANASGLAHGKDEVYRAYGRSKERIVAVLHFFDIDVEWFNAQGNFGSYRDANEVGTFYRSLEHAPGALFVANLAMPVLRAGLPAHGREQDVLLGDQFHNLLGLAWQHVMLHRIAAEAVQSGRVFPFDIVIASTTNWMHVADRHVYQLLEAPVLRETRVRDLSQDLGKEPVSLDSLLKWAIEEIESTAEGGCSGEQFLCATLFSHPTVQGMVESMWMRRWLLRSILVDLGMGEWLRNKGDYVEGLAGADDVIEERCLDIFANFLTTVATHAARPWYPAHLADQARTYPQAAVDDAICPVAVLAHEVV